MSQREKIATWPSDRANRMSVKPSEALSGNRVITAAEIEQYQSFTFDPSTTSRDISLPDAAACAGAYVFIANRGLTTGTLVVKNAAAATIVTIPVTAAGKVSGALLFCDGTNWLGLYGSVA